MDFSSSRCPFWAIDATLYLNLLIYMCSWLQIVLLTHRNAFCWIDEWFDLSLDEVWSLLYCYFVNVEITLPY